jgi:hypothetical protein
VPRIDIPAKVTGGAAFVQDLRLPGMVHGRVVRPPRYGARLDSFDEARVKAMPGVIAVVRDGSFLGVVARREEQAINARLVLIEFAKWSGGSALPDPAKMYEQLMSLRSEDRVIGEKDAPVPGRRQGARGDVPSALSGACRDRASCALAEFKDGKLTVWTHSQGVFPLRATLARALGLQPRDIRCIHAEGPGCYGHNGADDVAFDAAMLARAVNGRPVRLQWMRDDEFKWEPYGPAMTMKVKGAVAGGRVVDWTFDVWSQSHNMRPGDPDGINLLGSWYLADAKRPGPARHAAQPNGAGDRNAITLYDFPRQRTTHHLIMDNPGAHLGAAHARRLCQRVRDRVLHGRARGRRRHRPGGVPPRAHQGRARARRDRGRGQGRRLETGREGRRPARPRHRLCALQDRGHLRCGDSRG